MKNFLSLTTTWIPARTRSNVRQPMVNGTLGAANPFNYGAGQISPNHAMDPGLVYDLTTTDYLNFLCSIGYNSTQLSTFMKKKYKCPSKPTSPSDLNYPSITVPSLSGKVTVTRTLKNVGTPATYTVRTKVPGGISVKVEPKRLKFEKINEEKTFKVTPEAKRDHVKGGEYVFGRLIWSDGEHYLRSPIVVNATTTTLHM